MLRYYSFDFTQALTFANIDFGNLWFFTPAPKPDSHQVQSAAPVFLVSVSLSQLQ